jgi:hypothetical protein
MQDLHKMDTLFIGMIKNTLERVEVGMSVYIKSGTGMEQWWLTIGHCLPYAWNIVRSMAAHLDRPGASAAVHKRREAAKVRTACDSADTEGCTGRVLARSRTRATRVQV